MRVLFIIFYLLINANALDIFDIQKANVWIIDTNKTTYSYYIPKWTQEATLTNDVVTITDENNSIYTISDITNIETVLVNNLNKSYPLPSANLPNGSLVGLSAANSVLNNTEAYCILEPQSGLFQDTVKITFNLLAPKKDTYILEYHFDNEAVKTHTFTPSNTQPFSIFLAKSGTHKLYYGLKGTTQKSTLFTIENNNTKRDTDGDGLPDVWEIQHNLNPLENSLFVDSDNNGWSDFDEIIREYNLTDSDGDGWSDWDEKLRGTDPYNSKNCIDMPTAESLYGVEYVLDADIYNLDYNLSTGEYKTDSNKTHKTPLQRITLMDIKADKLFDTSDILEHTTDTKLCQKTPQEVETFLTQAKVTNLRIPASLEIITRAQEYNPFNNHFWVAKSLLKATPAVDVKKFYSQFKDSNETDFTQSFVTYLKNNLVVHKNLSVDQNSSTNIALLESFFKQYRSTNALLLLGNPDNTITMDEYNQAVTILQHNERSVYDLYHNIEQLQTSIKRELIKQYGGDNTNIAEIKLAQYAQTNIDTSLQYTINLFQYKDLQTLNNLNNNINDPDADSDGDGWSNKDEIFLYHTNPLEPDSKTSSTTLPELSYYFVNNKVTEGNVTNKDFLIELKLNKTPTQTASVDVAFIDINATQQQDYTTNITTVNFAKGQIRAYIAIAILADTQVEGDEDFQVVFKNLHNISMKNKSFEVTIIDDDKNSVQPYILSFDKTSYEVDEDFGTLNIPLHLSASYDKNITVTFKVSGSATSGEDYDLDTNITIVHGTQDLMLQLYIKDNNQKENTENIDIAISSIDDDNITISADKNHTNIIIYDNDNYLFDLSSLIKTGRNIFADIFDDGYYEAGIQRDFVKNAQNVIDNVTTLIWQDDSSIDNAQEQMFNWEEAQNYCQNRGEGWRLPTVKELYFISNKKDVLHSATALDQSFQYKGQFQSKFWSLDSFGSDFAWYVDFDTNNTLAFENKSSKLNARCIRYTPDTKLQFSKLERHGDDINDTKNNLVWKDSEEESKHTSTYLNAIDYCHNLGEGWRLPNIFELVSITDFTKQTPAIKDPFVQTYDINNTNVNLFWSATPTPTYLSTNKVWALSTTYGKVVPLDTNTTANFRCIKGGEIDNNSIAEENTILNYNESQDNIKLLGYNVQDNNTTYIMDIENLQPAEGFTRINNDIYYLASGKLYKTNLNTFTTSSLKEFSDSLFSNMVKIDDKIYFMSMQIFDSVVQLYQVDNQSVTLLKEFESTIANTDLINFNKELYLNGSFDGKQGLYKYSPVQNQFQLIKESSDTTQSFINFTLFNGALYFTEKNILYAIDTNATIIHQYTLESEEIRLDKNDNALFIFLNQDDKSKIMKLQNSELLTIKELSNEYSPIAQMVGIFDSCYFTWGDNNKLSKINTNNEIIDVFSTDQYFGNMVNIQNRLYFTVANKLYKISIDGNIKLLKEVESNQEIEDLNGQFYQTQSNFFFSVIFSDTSEEKSLLFKVNIFNDNVEQIQ